MRVKEKSMRRLTKSVAAACAAVVMTAAAAVPAAADFVFYKNGRIIEGEMLITPSLLQFRMTARYVELFWDAPSFPVKSYLVYVRRGKNDYLFYDETSLPRIRLKGLECGTEYSVHVTSIDDNNRESAPSNDIRFVTFAGKPLPPPRPRVISITREVNGLAARLVWDRAFDSCGGPVKEYAVYVNPPAAAAKEAVTEKKKAAGAAPVRFPGFVQAGRTTGTVFLFGGLREDVRYTVMVTALDGLKNESVAETMAFTAAVPIAPASNRRPAAPYPVECRKIVTGNGKEMAAYLYWKEAGDPDGYVAAYRVYRKKGSVYEQVGTTTHADFQVRGLPYTGSDCFVVRSVDDRGAESADSVRVTTGVSFPVTITGRFACMVPHGTFGRFFNSGCGWLFNARVGVQSFMLGAETGYLRFGGKTDKTRETSIVPFMVTASWEFRIAPWVSIVPGIAAGGSYNTARVSLARMPLFRLPMYRIRTAIEPMVGAGMTFLFYPAPLLVIQADAEYRGIIEAGGVAGFFSFGAGAGIRF
jgi:hypothetical protein